MAGNKNAALCTDIRESERARGTQGTDGKKELEKRMAGRLGDVKGLSWEIQSCEGLLEKQRAGTERPHHKGEPGNQKLET